MSLKQFDSIAQPHLFAHRGGNRAGKIENTKESFIRADKLGYKFIETDVILTKDRQVICYHGSRNRFTKKFSGLEVRKVLQQLTYNQIKSQGIAGNGPPKLLDILEAFPKTRFSIDAKTKEVAEPLVEVIKQAKAANRAIITSFNLERTLTANRRLRGDNLKASYCLSLTIAPIVSLLPGPYLSYLKFRGVIFLQTPYRFINQRLVNAAKKRQMIVYAWTVNDERAIRKMFKLGVHGIMSDDPELLLKVAKDQKA